MLNGKFLNCRPQTKFQESTVCTLVCDSVHRGKSLSREGLCLGRVSVQGGLCPGVSVWGISAMEKPLRYGGRAGGTHPTGTHSC